METQNKVELIEKLVYVNRVSKTVKGGRNMSFAVIAVVGDGRGRCGVAKGKASEAQGAARKAVEAAKKSMIKVPLYEGRTLHHDIKASFGRGRVVLRSAPPGTGIIAGGVMRSLLESLGVQDVVCKSFASNNPHNVLKATMKAFASCLVPRTVANRRRVKLSSIQKRRHAASAGEVMQASSGVEHAQNSSDAEMETKVQDLGMVQTGSSGAVSDRPAQTGRSEKSAQPEQSGGTEHGERSAQPEHVEESEGDKSSQKTEHRKQNRTESSESHE